MNRDSLLPKSLFSASTLKLEPQEESLQSAITQQQRRRKSAQQEAAATLFTPTPLPATPTNESSVAKKRKVNIFDSDKEDEKEVPNTKVAAHTISDSDSSSNSSSSSEDEEDNLEMQFSRNGTFTQINHAMNTLLIKLERQQARQNRYLDKVKNLNKAIKKTSRLIGYHANLLVETANQQRPIIEKQVSPSPPVVNKETISVPQLAKRSAPFENDARLKQRRVIIDDDDSDESSEVAEDHLFESNKPNTPAPTKQQKQKVVAAPRPLFSVHRTARTKRSNTEISFGKSEEMDIYTVRRKNQEIMSSKKPRSLLYNITDNNMDRGMSELMITTSLDGELQFWNSVERRKIKTIGNDHLYDTWIDDICWATPSTLAFCPPQKSNEPVKLVHIGNVTKTNVEGRIQTLADAPHDNGISVISSLDTGTYASRNSETCSFVTGGYDKSVYVWSLKRESPVDNFTQTGVHRLNIKHTAAVFSLCYDKFRNTLFSGGSDERLIIYDMQSNSMIRELRLAQRVSQIVQSKANPNIMLITTTNRVDQFSIYDQRVPGFDGIRLRFGQQEQETLSRFIRPDMHENGYMVCCGGQEAPKLNFWDLRYTGVSRAPSFGMDTQGVTRSLRSMFLPHQDTIVSMSSSRYMTWIDYAVKKDEIVKSLM